MPTYEVSRTLVKSAPEVWAELERVERLAELLGDGTIEIVSSKAESQIEWRGERASGTIEIAASGWGTKVKLTAEAVVVEVIDVADVVAAPDAVDVVDIETEPIVKVEAEPFTEAASESVAEVEIESVAETEPKSESEFESQPEPIVEAEPGSEDVSEAEAASAPARVGFWKRLMARFENVAPEGEVTLESEPESAPVAVSAARADLDPEPVIEAEPKSESMPEPEPAVQVEPVPVPAVQVAPAPVPVPSVQVASVPESMNTPPAIDYEAILTGMLDHLGSAHKRPFTAT